MLMKLQVFSSALMGVVFPAFAATYLLNHQRTVELFTKSLLLIGSVMFMIALLSLMLGQIGLTLWLGSLFRKVYGYVISFVPFALLQAIGRSDVTAKINLLKHRLFCFFILVVIRVGHYGAATAPTLRLVITQSCFGFSAHLYPAVKQVIWRATTAMLVGVIVLLGYMGGMY